MKVKCIDGISTWWGSQFTEGKYYEMRIFSFRNVSVITDYVKYWELNSQILSFSLDEIKNNPNVVDLQRALSRAQKKLIKVMSLQHMDIMSDDDKVYNFLLSTDEDLFEMGADKNPDGEPAFSDNSIYRFDEHFKLISEIREEKLIELGII